MKRFFPAVLVILLCFSPILQAQPKALFERWDRDGDGKVTASEFPKQLMHNFNKADADNNGAISMAEHLKFIEQNQAQRRNAGLTIVENIDYVGDDNRRQSLDLYVPKNAASTNLPLIVFIHGGAWRGGDKRVGLGKLRRYLADGRYAGASVGYRLSQHAVWPAQIHDCKAAIRYLRANARSHGIDPERIAVWGSSAGGHLVGMLGVSGGVDELEGSLGPHTNVSSRVQAVVNFYGPSRLLTMNDFDSVMDHNAPDSPESQLIGAPVQEAKDKARAASPFHFTSKDDAPFLHVHGTQDKLVPLNQSQVFDQALRKAGVESTLLTIEGGGHGGFRNPKVNETVGRFFDHHLYGKKVDWKSETIPNE